MNFSTDQESFPLCALCRKSLVPCPVLCQNCGSPACTANSNQACSRPWIRYEGIQSFSALYLLLNTGFPVLRKWKTRRGPLFDRQVLRPDKPVVSGWKEFQPQAVIPIPQSWKRSWKLRGSPADRIARWVGSLTGVPVARVLLPPQGASDGERKRQAELSILQRLQKPTRFSIRSGFDLSSIRRAILVDDFMTSGRTLGQAAKVLKEGGVEQIHVFCLGVRVSLGISMKERK